jgi:rubrerythrin
MVMKKIDTTYDSDELETTLENYGWICPVCGRGNSPDTRTCPCMGEITFKW